MMADTAETTKKRVRRGKRGSGKNEKLQNEISRLVQSELHKYEQKLEKLAQLHNASILQRQTDAQMPRSKCWKEKVRNKIKSKKAAVKCKNPPVTATKNVQPHMNKNLKKIPSTEENVRVRLLDTILKEISTIKISNSDCDKILPSQNFAFPKAIHREKMKKILEESNEDSHQYLTGILRVNNKQSKNCYVSSGDNDEEDVLIDGMCDRNRAMDKDLVAIQIHAQDKWIQKANGRIQKTALVVSILEKVHPRKAIGILVYMKQVLRFHPRDKKFPVMTIDPATLPEEFKESDSIKRTLFIGKMLNWSTPTQCSGKILGRIGDVGDLEAETAAILLENGLDVTPYDAKLYQHLPGPDYVLQEMDLAEREDWRLNCVFTIDPATAVDLDDAVSCRRLDNGNFQVGVHIADVTYFLQASSALDEMVSQRATTIYLVNTVYHMLPKSLCQLCSLLPGKDRLTFSVIWELTPTGDIVSHRFTRSIINSCFQMSYQQAQRMIESPDLDWSEVDLPNVKNGFTASDMCQRVNDLFSISKSLRLKRFETGALKIDQPKMQIMLDEVTRLPISYCLEQRVESNELIEEFMLLANMTVANHLYKKFPKTALLRHHDPPKHDTLSRTLQPLKNFGVHLNTKSAGALQMSMSKYEQTIERGEKYSDEEFVANGRMMVINSLCAQAMVRANYVCSGSVKSKSSLKHYALNVPMYTHFTSPIRRYSDCIVHRLLASDLNDTTPLPENWSSDLCASLAKNCNKMKDSAKSAQDKSNEIYFIHLIAHNGPTEYYAIVMSVRQHSLDVILCHVGLTLRVELSEIQNNGTIEYSNDDSVETVKILWKEPVVTQVINVFTILSVRVRKHPKRYCIQASLLPPKINYYC